jgi:dephospho-CoA kinase
MKKIGITGGIGSGKTYVSSVFTSLGIPVFNADIEAKRLMVSCENSRNNLEKIFILKKI